MNESSESILKFRCPHCSVVLKSDATDAGKQRRCPKCKQRFKIPKPKLSRDPSAKRTVSAVKKRTKKKQAVLIPVVCGVCQTRVYARENQIGSSVECPDCFTQNLVKPPAKKPQKTAPRMDASMNYDIEPEREIEVTTKLGQDLLAKADEQVVNEIEAAPKLPNRPFVSGVYSYPLRKQVFPLLIGMTLGWTLLIVLVRLAILLPFIVPVAAIIGMMVILPTLVCFQKMVENTSNLDDDSECRPDGGLLAFLDWMGETIPLAMALFLSGLPTFLLVRGLSLELKWLAAVPLASFVFFPLIYLSMLEAASTAGVFSRAVWGSLLKVPGTWFKFYLSTGMVSLLSALAIAGMAYWRQQLTFPPALSNMIGVLSLVVAITCVVLAIYFRLIGRMAFVLSQKIMVDKPGAWIASSNEGASSEPKVPVSV